MSGRPAHCPFRGLLGVHSRCGLSPIRDTLIEGFSHFVTSMTAPIAFGWSGCRVGLAPTGKRRLVTAHTPSRHHAAKFAALREGTSSTLVSPATMPSPGLGKAMKRRPGAGGKTSRAARHAATTRSYPKNFCLVDRSEPLRLLFRPASHPFHRYGPSANWQAENQLRELRAWCANSGHTMVREYVERESGRKGADSRIRRPFDDAAKRNSTSCLFWAVE